MNNNFAAQKQNFLIFIAIFVGISTFFLFTASITEAASTKNKKHEVEKVENKVSLKKNLEKLWKSAGAYGYFCKKGGWKALIMVIVGLILLWLGIFKQFEPLLLIPIGFGGILANIPFGGAAEPGGLLDIIYSMGVKNGLFPLLIFLGVGAMTDFGPLIANPKTALLGAAAQAGIFITIIGAVLITEYVPNIAFTMKEAASVGIIGGADGPTAIFLSSKLSPNLMGSIAIAAYSYMALVPVVQPPVMNLLTSKNERQILMKQLRPVGRIERIAFPLIVFGICLLLLPSASQLIGMLMLGNLMKECGVVDRLAKTASNDLINICTILLGLAIGSKLGADQFLQPKTLGIISLGLFAFIVGTAFGVLLAKFMNIFLSQKINPLIGSAGVSAVPMAARVSNKVGLDNDPNNYLLMHAMGPNVAGVIGSAVAAGVLLALLG